MEMTPLEKNTLSLNKEIQWLETIVNQRIQHYFHGKDNDPASGLAQPPDLSGDGSNYASLVEHYKMGPYERVLLILALVPHVRPQVLDVFFSRNATYNREFTEFGGYKGNIHSGFLPTAETAAFILGGNNLNSRFRLQNVLAEKYYLRKHQIIILDSPSDRDPFYSRPLRISQELLSFLTTGE
jgi:hypothetical protein